MKTWTVEELQNDWNFQHAFSEAQTRTYGNKSTVLQDVVEVIAAAEGENDGPAWVALCKLKNGKYIKMFAGCDYTGWDCQAGGNIEYYDTKEELLSVNTLTKEERERLGV